MPRRLRLAPASDSGPFLQSGSPPHSALNKPRFHLLVVEDDDRDYCLLEEALLRVEESAFDFSRATTRREGVGLLDARAFDAILFDLTLPDSLGLEGLKRFLPFARETPVIVLTGSTSGGEGARSLAVGAQDYLGKEALDGSLIHKSVRYSIERQRLMIQQRMLQEKANHTQKLDVVSTLAAGLAHDLSNILTPLVMSAELGLARCKDDALSELFGDIRNSARWASDLAGQLMAVNRDTRKVEMGIVDASDSIERAAKLIRTALPRGVKLEVEGDLGSASIIAGGTDIQQLLFNLCINAAQAIGDAPDGRICIALARELRSEPSGASEEFLRVTVRDNGPGFSEGALGKAFEPFYSTKKKIGGIGLGLSVCFGIARRLGGSIVARNASGGGAEVEFAIPISGDENVDGLSYESLLALKGDQSILLIDNDERILRRTQRLLSFLGYDVEAHSKPGPALDALRSDGRGYDLVVIEHSMKEMSGLQLAARVRELNPRVAIVIASAYLDMIDDAEARRLCISSTVPKPYGSRQIVEALRKSSVAV